MKRGLFFLLVIFLFGLAGCASQAVDAGEPGPADDYAVYAVLLNSAIFPNGAIRQAVIRDVTEYDLAATAASAPEKFRSQAAGLDPAAMDAFEKNNEQH